MPPRPTSRDGVIPERYFLCETTSRDYLLRTKQNILDSDATLVINLGPLEGGTLETVRRCVALGKPHLVLQLEMVSSEAILRKKLLQFLSSKVAILNVAGPRESKRAGIYALTAALLEKLFSGHA